MNKPPETRRCNRCGKDRARRDRRYCRQCETIVYPDRDDGPNEQDLPGPEVDDYNVWGDR
jgi:hypothetical protein